MGGGGHGENLAVSGLLSTRVFPILLPRCFPVAYCLKINQMSPWSWQHLCRPTGRLLGMGLADPRDSGPQLTGDAFLPETGGRSGLAARWPLPGAWHALIHGTRAFSLPALCLVPCPRCPDAVSTLLPGQQDGSKHTPPRDRSGSCGRDHSGRRGGRTTAHCAPASTPITTP